MKKLILAALLLGLAGITHAYSIKHSYSSADNSTEYYGACNDGRLLKVTEYPDGRFHYEGPAGDGTVDGPGALDKAAAAACGE